MAPGSSGGNSLRSSAAAAACAISAFDFPARASLVFMRKMGAKLLAAAGLKQMGERTFGFQNSASSLAAPRSFDETEEAIAALRRRFVSLAAQHHHLGGARN